MNIVKQDIDQLNAKLVLKVEEADYKEKVSAALKKMRKSANMPGFRPGQVPMGLIKKTYGQKVLADELNNLINDALYKYINEEKLDILGNPLPVADSEKGDWKNPSDFEFTYELGLAPQIEVKLSKKDKVDFHILKVEDKIVDEELDNAARRFGKLSTPETSEDNDMVVGSLIELDADGNIKEGGVMNETTISLEFLKDAKAKKSLLGVKEGDVVKVSLAAISENDEDKAKMLGVAVEALADIADEANFNVTSIRRIEKSEINEDLAKKLFGEDTDAKTEAEIRAKIKENIQEAYKKDAERLFKKAVTAKVRGKLKVDLPDEFLKRWIKASNEQPITDEQLEGDYPKYAENLVDQLIENKVVSENEIKVEADEVIAFTKELLIENSRRQGFNMDADDAQLDEYAKNVLQNQKEAENIYQMLFDQKITAFYKDTVKIEEKETEMEEFFKLFYQM